MWIFTVILTQLIILFCTCEDAPSYKGHKIYNLVPQTKSHLIYLLSLQDDDKHIKFWSPPTTTFKDILVQVSPQMLVSFQRELVERRIPFVVKMQDVQEKIEHEKSDNFPQMLFRVMGVDAFDLGQYHTLDEIYLYMDLLSAQKPEIVSVDVIGKTHEGREIKALRIQKSESSWQIKPIIFIDAGIHAREWIAPATALYIIKQLLSDTGSSNDLLDIYDWYIIPVLNPDGYEYSWTKDRLWRKNRKPHNSTSSCKGVDLNRNFDIGYEEKHFFYHHCSLIYPGPEPFSELETQALRDLLTPLKHRLAVTFSLHSFSQVWVTPYLYKEGFPDNYSVMEKIMHNALEAARKVNHVLYGYGPGATLMYAAPGTTADWFYEVLEVKYPFIIELRDKGDYGFLLPKSQIKPTANETWVAIEYAVREVAKLNKYV